jgi:hypothetical protein
MGATMTEACSHTFKTTLLPDKFEATVARACREAYRVVIEGHDPTIIPAIRVFRVDFVSVEDRDRARIAFRFTEKETPEFSAAARKPVASRMANA